MLGSMGYPPRSYYPVVDGFVVYHNLYDGQLYCVGKGPSATTVSAPDVAVSYGTPVIIKGTATALLQVQHKMRKLLGFQTVFPSFLTRA